MTTPKQLILILALTASLLSCNKPVDKPIETKLLTEAQQTAKLDKLKLDFNQPVLIDSSVYVMCPLTLNNNEEEKRPFLESNYSSSTTYWNIIFYNTANGEYHLLDNKRRMVIYSYNPRNSNNYSTSSSSSDFNKYLESGYNQVDKLLYYSVTVLDFNNDGKLNAQDPSYLFISDKAGRNFKQVSPDNVNVTDWQTIKGTNKILIQVTKDTNNDKVFNNIDETIPMVFDLNTNEISKAIFKEEFIIKLKKQLDTQWTKNE